jgi:uncharacterized protein (DUF2336 family)
MIYSLINEIQDGRLSGSAKRQIKALMRITDLFAAGSGSYSRQQIELFDEVFKALVAVIELRTRVKLVRHIAANSNTPAALVRALAFDDEIAVAGPVSQSIDRTWRGRYCPVRTQPEPGPSLRNRAASDHRRNNH